MKNTQRFINVTINNKNVRWFYMRTLKVVTAATLTLALTVGAGLAIGQGIDNTFNAEDTMIQEFHNDTIEINAGEQN